MNSHPINQQVTDRQSFIKFLESLHQDFIDNGQEWESKTLDGFLEALSRYTVDIQGYYDNTNQNINADNASWQVFADIIKGAKIYE